MKRLIATTIGVTIAIITLAAVLMPVLEDSMATSDTFTNEGYFRMSHFDSTTDHAFSWDYTNPNYVTVDGDLVKIGGAINKSITVLADTNWLVRMTTDASGDVTGVSLIMSSGGTTSATVSNSTSATVTLEAGSMSATFGTTDKTGSYSDLYMPSNNGNLIMKDSDKDAYMLGDSQFVAYGLTRVKTYNGGTTSSPGFGIEMIGSYTGGVTTTIWRDANNNTIKDETVNVTPVSSHTGLYKMESITGTFVLEQTVDGSPVYTETPITYNYFIVPYQVTADRAVHLDPASIGVLAAIPIIIIAAILMLAVSIIGRNRE